MSVAQYAHAVACLADFPSKSPLAEDKIFDNLQSKMVGMIGGEPLLHPQFDELAAIVERLIPERQQRGLWTGLNWQKTKHRKTIERVFGYVNNNTHIKAIHSPVLTAVEELVPDIEERQKLIDNCWLQRIWSSTITPKGFFFCEVAGAMDMVFNGPGGLPVEPGCWRRPIADFQDQINCWCNRCGIPLNLPGRLDSDEIDDVTPNNLKQLTNPKRCIVHTELPTETSAKPWNYMQ
jgi:hypothetical protein